MRLHDFVGAAAAVCRNHFITAPKLRNVPGICQEILSGLGSEEPRPKNCAMKTELTAGRKMNLKAGDY